MQRRGEIIVALHPGAVSGDGRHRDPLARAQIGAAKAVAGRQHHPADAGRSRGAFRLGDALDGEARRLGAHGALLEHGDRRQFRIKQIELRKVACQERRFGEPGEAILGRDPRHGDRALRQLIDIVLDVVGRHHRLAFSDQDPQADIVALGALGALHLAVAHLDRGRHGTDRDRIGRVGAGAPRRRHQALGEIGERGLVEQGCCHEGFLEGFSAGPARGWRPLGID
jgi:hypothetical protein